MKKKNIPLLILLLMVVLVSLLLYSRKISSQKPCANTISCTKDLSGTYDPALTTGEYMGKTVRIPQNIFEPLSSTNHNLGIKTVSFEKKIFINLETQQLFAYEGNELIYNFTISSGKIQETPVGKFTIWAKLQTTHMEGGEKSSGTYYSLPNVPYTMYFYNEYVGKWEGYGIHAAYWQDTFGYPSSFGCILMAIDDAKRLYYWTEPFPQEKTTFATNKNPGTTVVIYGKTP